MIVDVGCLRIPIEAVTQQHDCALYNLRAFSTTNTWTCNSLSRTLIQRSSEPRPSGPSACATSRVPTVHNPARTRFLHEAPRYFVAAPILSFSRKDNYLLTRQPGNAPNAAQSSRRRRKMREEVPKEIKAECSRDKGFHEQQGQENRQEVGSSSMKQLLVIVSTVCVKLSYAKSCRAKPPGEDLTKQVQAT